MNIFLKKILKVYVTFSLIVMSHIVYANPIMIEPRSPEEYSREIILLETMSKTSRISLIVSLVLTLILICFVLLKRINNNDKMDKVLSIIIKIILVLVIVSLLICFGAMYWIRYGDHV